MSTLMRPATIDDLAAITDIVTAAYSPYVARMGREPAPMTVDYQDILTRGDLAHVLVDDGVVVGVVVIVDADDHLLIENVAVAPGHQGSGYGRALLQYAETRAAQGGLSQTRLYTNAAMTENLTFYPRLGYVEVDRRIEDGFDRVFYRKDLV